MLPSGPYTSEWTALPPGAMLDSKPRMKPGTISIPMTVVQPKSVLNPWPLIPLKGYADAQALTAYWGHVVVQGPPCSSVDANLRGLCSHPGPW